jgi:dihydrofolate reductase
MAAPMSKLIYITNMSVDGYIEDETGGFSWVNPDQVFSFITELIRPIGTHLYGRRLYETMAYWDAPVESYKPEQQEFARVWQKGEKIVFSGSLATPHTRNTRLEHDFKIDLVRKLKLESQQDLTIGGAQFAGLALEAGLVDECHLFINPIAVGHGKPAFRTAIPFQFELLETRHFSTGVVYVRYRMGGSR